MNTATIKQLLSRRLQAPLLALALMAFFPAALLAQADGWPRTLNINEGTVTVYPPQVDAMDGDTVHMRAALAWRERADAEPVFGAGWFDSRVKIDRSKGVVQPLDLALTDVRFPAGTAELQPQLSQAVAQQSVSWNMDFPLEQLVASLERAEQETKSLQDLNTQPPEIVYRDRPALLLTLDGDPVLREVENTPYQAVINTPFPLVFDGKAYYLSAAKGVWYRAAQATGPYRFESRPPADIVKLVDDAAEQSAGDEAEAAEDIVITAENAPEIVVATKPTELIVTDGPAAFVPLVDDLLVLDNSDNDVFMHISSQDYYVVLSGRWYYARSLNGPWSYRGADDLPPAFANIPKTSEQADSRVYVAGTDESREAVLDAQVPKTAAVERGTVDIDVAYDGEPDFEPVEGTQLRYASNSGSTVLQSDRVYYLVEDGVWYFSESPNGPWAVSDYRPEEVAAISPRSPVYNVKYVYVYDSTPEVVYVGYTPGYLGSYVYHGTIVYGTGWYYRPWVSPYYYYPRYSTWGFNVGYNPWYGWSFGLSWGWGPFYPGYYTGGYWHHNHHWYHRHYGYWGPRGYRPRSHYRYAYRDGHYGYRDHRRGGYHRDRYGHRGHDSRYDDHRGDRRYDSGRAGRYGRDDNLYRDSLQRARVVDGGGHSRRGNRSPADSLSAGGLRSAALDRGSREVAGSDKSRRSRIDPVSTSDLRAKAQVRDARSVSKQSRVAQDLSSYDKRRSGKAIETRQGKTWEVADATGRVRRAAAEPRITSDRAGTDKLARQRSSARLVVSTEQRDGTAGHARSRQPDVATAAKRGSSRVQPSQRAPEHRATTPRNSTGGNNSRSAPAADQQSRGTSRTEKTDHNASGKTSSRNTVPVRSAPRYSAPQRQESQRQTDSRPVPQRSAPQRAVQQRSTPQRSAPQRSAPQRSAPQRSAPQRVVQQRSAPQRSTPQRATPQRSAPQRSAPQRAAPQRSAPQRAAPQRSAPQRSAPQRGTASRGSRDSKGGGSRASRSRADRD